MKARPVPLGFDRFVWTEWQDGEEVAFGGTGSGNFGHAGRPGEVGGSTLGSHGSISIPRPKAPYGGGQVDTEGHYARVGDHLEHLRSTYGEGWKDHVAGATFKAPTEDGYVRPTPIKVDTIDEAVDLILDGKVVELKEVRQVSTVLHRLAAIAQEAKALGKDAPNYDLCQVTVSNSNLFCGSKLKSKEFPTGVPRVKMPQFGGEPVPGSPADKLPRERYNHDEVNGGDAFVKHVESLGIKTSRETMPAAKLKASQAELDGQHVAAMALDRHYQPGKDPIFVSRDDYVVDGHHRWASVVGRDALNNRLGDSKMNVIRVDAPISEVLHLANAWSAKFGIKPKAVKAKAASTYKPKQKHAWDDEFFDDAVALGGSGSGNFGHSGRPGEVGGSAGGGTNIADYKSERPLSGPESRHISAIIKGARVKDYLDVPGLSVLHRAMGVDASNGMTKAYNVARKAIFATRPVKDVPFDKLVYTQERINEPRVKDLANTTAQLDHPVFVLKNGGAYFVMNGHHRVAANKVAGRTSIKAHVFDVNSAWSFADRVAFGGDGSGNFGHAGRPGEVGGSMSVAGYHGSNVAGIKKFESSYGAVTAWFSEDKNLATQYADAKTRLKGGKSTVYAATLSIKKPLAIAGDMNDKVTYAKMRKETGLEFTVGEYGDEWVDGFEQKYKKYEIVTSPEFVDAAKSAGYDGLKVVEGGHNTWGVFDDDQITHGHKRGLNEYAFGGAGSGNFGHAGRPGEVGGSAPNGGSDHSEVHAALGSTVHVPDHVKTLVAGIKRGEILPKTAVLDALPPSEVQKIQTILDAGAEMLPEFAAKMSYVGDKMNLRAGSGDDYQHVTHEQMYVVAPIKGLARTAEKIAVEKPGESMEKITDVVRGTFVVKTPEQARAVLAEFQKRGDAFKVKDRITNYDETGYRDIKFLVQLSNGMKGEIQILTPNILRAKNGLGHRLYEKMRVTSEDSPVYRLHRRQSRKLYNAAWFADTGERH